jgi:hypothetical protein
MLNEHEQEQFLRLWADTQPSVTAFIHSVVRDSAAAKDLVQETALLLFRRFADYDGERPFLAWALGVAKLQVLGFQRDEARSLVTFDSELFDKFTEAWAGQAPTASRHRRHWKRVWNGWRPGRGKSYAGDVLDGPLERREWTALARAGRAQAGDRVAPPQELRSIHHHGRRALAGLCRPSGNSHRGMGYASVIGRVQSIKQSNVPPLGYWLKVGHEGTWTLFRHQDEIARGKTRFAANRWHRLGLKFEGNQITALVDRQVVTKVTDSTYKQGLAGFGCGRQRSFFENFTIRPASKKER